MPDEKNIRQRGKKEKTPVYIIERQKRARRTVKQIRRSKERDEAFLLFANAAPKLSVQEEFDLWQRIRAGDVAARNELVECHLRIVPKIAKAFICERLGGGTKLVQSLLPDFIAEGCQGLLDACNTFDPHIARFSTHANFWIKKRLYKYRDFISTSVHRPEGKPRPADLWLESPLIAADGLPTTGRATVGDVLTYKYITANNLKRELAEYKEEVIWRTAELAFAILEREELVAFMARYHQTPHMKLHELAAHLGFPLKRVWKIGDSALRKVARRTRNELKDED
jgi:RNA polymerase sigma factor (sigma-70 family)